MPRHRVLLTDYAWPDLEIEREILASADAALVVADRHDVVSLADLAVDVDAIMTCWAHVPAQVIDAAEKCHTIARLGIGLDNIDVAHATRRGIVVTNVPDYCLIEVAEHALALLFALARKVAHYHHETKLGRYDLKAGFPLVRLEGRTLGIVGLGNVGCRLATKAAALGMHVIGTTRRRETCPENIGWRTLDALLAESDFISLHVPSTPDTRQLIGAGELARMKPGAFLINTARGSLVDEAALCAALSSGHLGGAALDVQQHEPPDLSVAPFDDPRVIVTPHCAFASRESLIELRRRAARQVADRLAGRRPEHVVNPEVLGT